MSYRMLVTVSVAAALALTLAPGCKTQSEQSDTTRTTSASMSPTTSPATEGATAGAPAAESFASADKDFMARASQDSMLEVALGADAVRLGSSPAVKDFGERMVKDHSRADAELRVLAAKKGITLSSELDEPHKNVLERLEKLSGKAFDAELTKFMVSNHEADVKDLKKEASDAKDPDLRGWAAKSVPIVELQLVMAKSLKAFP